MKVLKLTLKRKWFNEIAAGKKTKEYREIKPHWNSRLLYSDGSFKEFDVVQFRNGYRMDKPLMRVGWVSTDYGKDDEGNQCFVISLGEILSIENYV